MNNINNLGISMRNSADIQAHSISIIKDNRVVSLEDYITEIAGDGGGGGSGSGDGYTQAEVDALLNTKLNVNNPQDIIGNLRLDPTNGNSKIILNAVSPPNATDDFYCNGNGQFNGSLRVSILTSTGDVNCDGVNADVFNSNVITNDIIFKHNDIEYMRFNVDDNTIDLSTDLDLQTSELLCNNVVFKIITDEFLRFQISDNTVRVPNTRSFLSQNIFTDIVKPLAFSNDVVFNGGNSTNDAYEEYVRLDASTEKVNISKETKFEDDIQLNVGQVIKFTHVFIREVQGTTRPEFDLIINGSTSHMRMWVAGAIRQAITNTAIACKVNIDAEQGITVFNGQQLKSNTINSHTNSNLVIQRSGSTLITLNSSNQVQLSGDLSLPTSNTQYIRFTNCNIRQGVAGDPAIVYFDFNNDAETGQYRFYIDSNTILHLRPLTTTISNELHLSNALYIDTANKLTLKPSLEGGVNIFDIRNLHPVADNPMIRFRVGEGGGETIVCEMSNNAVAIQRNFIVGTAYELRTNAIDTVNDNDLGISRNNVPFLTLDRFIEDTVEKEAIICSKQLRANGQFRINKLKINQITTGLDNFADVRLEDNNSTMRFFVGNPNDVNLQIIKTDTLNEILLNRNTKCSQTFYTNTIDTNTDTDLLIKRSGTEALRIRASDNLILTSDTSYFSSPKVYSNEYLNRTSTYDTVFYGANSTSDGRVEYMRWNRTEQSLDLNAPIDNTGIAITGNIIDTTVSDERLKTNIEDVDTDFTSCIKNVKVKTFKYKDDKYKTNDTYGFIAQELKEHLPKECKNIVKENKVKNEDETFLSINYMKLWVVLWKCCQEQQSKIEHLEASMYEMMEEIKELKGKKTTKPKAKAKSKEKA